MNILFISDLYPIIEDETIPSVVLDFTLGLKEIGNKITVLRPNFLINSLIRKHKILKEGIYFKNDIKIYNKNFILPPFALKKDYFKENFDIIISHMPLGHILAHSINKNLKLPHIAILHQSDHKVLNDFKYKFYFKNKLKKALENSTIKGARNNFLKENLDADFILPSFVKKENIIKKKSFNSEKLKFITLSKLIKRKNIDKVILGFSKIDFDFEYNIFGSGKENKKLLKLIKKLNLEDKIKINNHIRHNKIFDELDKNDVFILISENETFGKAYLEALSRGLITIGTKNTGIDGIIKNNENGFLIEAKTNEIVKILNEIKNLKNKKEISNNALKTAQNHEKSIIIAKYFKIIKKIYEKDCF